MLALHDPSKWLKWTRLTMDALTLIGQCPSLSKSKQLHVDICQKFFLKLWNFLYIPPKWLIIFLKSWTSTRLFRKLNKLIYNYTQ